MVGRIRELAWEQRRSASGAAAYIEAVDSACVGVAVERALPELASVCRGAEASIDPRSAAHCARGALERVAQTLTGVRVAPNFLFVLTDDQRWDTLWAMPLTRSEIGSRGIEFSESFASTSLCCPDRASILTGLYAHNHGVTSNGGARLFDHDGDTIARQLQENAGYETALLGKYMVYAGLELQGWVPPGWSDWQTYFEDSGLYYDYQLYENGALRTYGSDPEHYSTDLLRDRVLALMDRWGEMPWFIEYSPYAPHTEAIPADRHAGVFADLPPHRPPNSMVFGEGDKPDWVAEMQAFVSTYLNEPERSDAIRISQLETLRAVDEAVASFSDRLEASGLTDNTLVVFTSDNGYVWLEHWLAFKNVPYEESLRVPLLIRYPSIVHAPKRLDELVQPIDFYPTFAELAGVPGKHVNGRSLVPLLEGDAGDWRDVILFEHWGIAAGAGVRTHRWKLIESDATSGVTTELYDLSIDPHELDNVADEPANTAVLLELRAELERLLAE